ncbi:hypothetical protein ACU70A_06335 [Syntrophomonas erecta subsp. sporosyntropha]
MVIAAAKIRGINLDELDYMTWGQLIDYIIVYNNLHYTGEGRNEEEETIRQANQADFDNF